MKRHIYKPFPSESHKASHKTKIYKEKRIPIIDLHGLTKKEAMESCDRFLRENSGQRVEIIVGKGIHSPQGPVLKPAVKEMLKEREILHGELKRNPGRLWTVLPRKQ